MLGALPDGTLLIGYGDYGANTGPIDLLGLNPSTGAWSVLYADMPTEAIDTASIIDGHAWVPSTDPVGSGPGTLLTNSPAGTWRLIEVEVTGVEAALHLHGVAADSGALYVCGSRSITGEVGSAAIVWKSTDDGDTWTEDLAYPGDDTNPNLRFYYFRDLDGALCVIASDTLYHWTLDAGTWTQHASTPATGAAPIPVTHDGHAYWTNGETVYELALT